MTVAKKCIHSSFIKNVDPQSEGCKKCMELGDSWVSLRLCLSCGHVGCCDSSKNKHATKHFEETNHPIIEGYKTQFKFRWCYIDEATL